MKPISAPRWRRIGGDRAQCFGRGPEQDGVDRGLVLEGDFGGRRRQGEDDVEIRHRQQFGLPFGQPGGARRSLAFRAMPVATRIVLAHCWAHSRRKFYEVEQATGSPIATEAIRRIAELYAVEAENRGLTAEERRASRQQQSRPMVDAFKPWLEEQLRRIPGRGSLAEAIRYMLSRWHSLILFLDDGRVELDTNAIERAIRPIALGRKNALFAGSDGGARSWAIIASLIQTAKLNQVEPFAYLRDVLQQLVAGHTVNRLDELLPWNWKPATAAIAA